MVAAIPATIAAIAAAIAAIAAAVPAPAARQPGARLGTRLDEVALELVDCGILSSVNKSVSFRPALGRVPRAPSSARAPSGRLRRPRTC